MFANNHSIWNYPDKVEAERGPAKTGVEVMAEYKGVRIENHYDDERTRIIFDDKPSEEVRKYLKGHGFRWSPTNNAWQRKLTDNAVRHAKGILDKHFEPVVPMEGKPGESVPVEGRNSKPKNPLLQKHNRHGSIKC